ncbi:MAG: pantoate--beta-alanine ligase [Nitrospirae bacterium]|nr:pantoate--beta-alanine ligase [Nitrospirota bacterium]
MTRVIRSVRTMTAWSLALHREGVVIGVVPTMGALHDGHRSLIRRARLSCDAVVVSLFVNPSQFGPGEDFSRYPRPTRADAALCREEGVDVLFMPSREAVYPQGFQTTVTVRELARRWEGAKRPGHFDGVATVVTKLFGLVRPHVAFFGQKDFQQSVLVRRLVEDLNLGVRIVVCPTVRERDGLALSSRNRYLTPVQRRSAPVLHEALQAGRTAILRGIRFGSQIGRAMRGVIETDPKVTVDYLAVCDPDTLEPLPRVTKSAMLLGAVRLGRVRLIDNLLVRLDGR